MRRIAIGLLLALIATAAYLAGGLGPTPAPAPVVPTAPSEPGTAVCPPPPAAHPAVWLRRGDPCPQVTSTMNIGGEGT